MFLKNFEEFKLQMRILTKSFFFTTQFLKLQSCSGESVYDFCKIRKTQHNLKTFVKKTNISENRNFILFYYSLENIKTSLDKKKYFKIFYIISF